MVANLSGGANNIDIVGFDVGNAPNALSGYMGELTGTAAQSTSGNSVHLLNNYFHDIAQTYGGPYGSGCPDTGMVQALNQHSHYVSDFQAIGNRLNNFAKPSGLCTVDSRHHGPGIYAIAIGAHIENNIISNTNNEGIQVYENDCLAVVSNNIVFHTRGNSGIIVSGGGGVCPTIGNNSILNNIVDNIDTSDHPGTGIAFFTAGDCSSTHPSLWSNNISFGNVTNYQGQGSCDTISNQKTENPTTTFFNYQANGSGDYHLKAGSAGINAGTTSCVSGGASPCTPSTDFDGKTRPQGSAIDIGAYEQ